MNGDLDGLSDLPNEIITDIFLFCLPQGSFLHLDPRNAPILLTHICSSWRTFVTHVPTLWKSIALSNIHKLGMGRPPFYDVNLEKRMLEQVALWSANSHTQQLAVSVDFRLALIPDDNQRQARRNSIFCIESPSFWDRVLRHAIVENAHRLRKLFLRLELTVLGSVIFDMTSESIPALETLHVVLSPPWGTPAGPASTRVTTFSKPPNLRRVVLALNSPLLEIDIPWAQLTHVALLQVQSTSKIYSVLQQCPFLQALSIVISDGKEPIHVTTPTIMAIHLKELAIGIYSNKDVESFLVTIQFPALNHLRLCRSQESGSLWSFDVGFKHFVNQLNLLHSLTLGYQNISSEALLEVLCRTPLLVDLTVDSELVSYTSFLENLTYQPEAGDETLIPKLEYFNLYLEIDLEVDEDGLNAGRNISFTNDAFLSMIVSRSPIAVQTHSEKASPACLKNVLLCVEHVEEGLQIVDLDGLSIQLRKLSALGLDMDVNVQVSDNKSSWLREETPTWC
ncbi:hypothetical protein GALMADRAFT_277356 [Galerina marginata CBS 339.88]|uniref:Uncharacterized protein n=1 Tax=Galerina marginata (strain CBS 339.88) TaxID=685588 RepID=A0A067TCJ3_GALM3|nr:hypothetical protein GALMADRAFT_277356 [Galerina marginata CBS 339.88]